MSYDGFRDNVREQLIVQQLRQRVAQSRVQVSDAEVDSLIKNGNLHPGQMHVGYIMAVWAIGDIQGCHDELTRLIDKLRFDPASDTLWFCGDLVNRGGQSLAVLRAVKAFGDRAIVALGNHDLSLLAIAERKREDQQRVNPELREILFAPDRDELLGWLRRQKLLHVDRSLDFALVHAGLFPRWTIAQAEEMAQEIEDKLRSEGYRRLLKQLFGNKPDLWTPKLRGIDRWRAGINVFTRMR